MQICKSSPKIPKTLFNSPEEILQQKIQDKYGYPDRRGDCEDPTISQATEAALLKYYPKYCHAVHLDKKPKRWSVVSRIKHIKSFSHFEYEFGYSLERSQALKQIRKWFENKRKSIKSLPVIGFEEESGFFLRHLAAMEMCSFFPQIETLKVCIPLSRISKKAKRDFIPASVEDHIVSVYGRFWDVLKHVRHLEILANPNLWVIFSHLQKSEKFLSSLESFRLTITSYRVDSTGTPQKIFQSFLRNPGVLKYVTHLNVQRFKDLAEVGLFHLYGDQIKAILDCCTKLQSLIFPVEKEFYETHSFFANSKQYLTLAPLQSLKNLSALDLIVYDIWSFCIAFEFPPQLKKVALRLYWRGTRGGNSRRFDNFFTNNDSPDQEENSQNEEKIKASRQILQEFFEKVSKLAQLKSLKLSIDASNNILKNFIAPLLQAIPKLQQFEYGCYRSKDPIDLSVLLNEIDSRLQLQPVIEEVQFPQNFHFVTDFNSMTYQNLSFSNIVSISIDAQFPEDFDFRAFFRALSNGSKQKEINIVNIEVSSIPSLLKLLKTFKEAEQFPNLKISTELVLRLQDWEDIKKYLEETIIPARNVTIHLRIEISSSENIKLPAERIMKLQKVFAKMKFTLTLIAGKKKIKMVSK